MKVSVNFSVISFNGQPNNIEIDMVCPDFKEENLILKQELLENSNIYKKYLEINPYCFINTIEKQIIDWLVDNIDKTYIIHEYDLAMILDYEVIKCVDKNNTLVINKNVEIDNIEILKTVFKDKPDMLLNYIAVYAEMKDVVKGLPFIEQFKIIMKSVDVAIISKTDAFRYVNELLKSPTSTEMKNKIDNSRGLLN